MKCRVCNRDHLVGGGEVIRCDCGRIFLVGLDGGIQTDEEIASLFEQIPLRDRFKWLHVPEERLEIIRRIVFNKNIKPSDKVSLVEKMFRQIHSLSELVKAGLDTMN